MNVVITLGEQLLLFIFILAAGIFTGLLFDLAKAVRIALQLAKSILFLVDMLLCVPVALVVYQTIYFFNQGEIRSFVYLSFVLGIVLYYYFFSRHLYKHILHTLKYIVKLWHKFWRNLFKLGAACRRFFGKSERTGGDFS